ncbi:sushi, von Willebrand factor type A, EGF and pentraxin domain-containing protein 1-like [Halichondria panicea]|uniref:sushi, von Willebrand factor type A, EGF and pentraxin domain-containing protein 1-like n=1 Tax=Halichondria panicea TaxID=6063 RepID=UPI00312BBAC1
MKTALFLLVLIAIGSCVVAVNALDFTLKRYGGRVLANSVIDISRVGREYRPYYYYYYRTTYTNEGPLVCHTETPNCCRDVDDPFENEENGEWFYPDGQVVGSSQQYYNFYVTRARQELHLHSYSANSPTGVYCCDVRSVNGSGNITAEYVSETNYTSINSSTSKCVGLYTYSQLRLCRDFSIGNGLVTYDSPYIPGRVASISCNRGFSLVGSSERTCTNGGWSGTTPNCVYDCGPLPVPRNGRVDTSTGTTVGKTATYSCNEGYNLIGSLTRNCQYQYNSYSRYSSYRYTGVDWSSSAPICVDEAKMQLMFSPTPGSCLEWEESRANRITLAFIGAIEEVLLNYASIALPHINFANLTHSPFSVERSFFSCRSSQTEAHFRTTLFGLEDVSAHEMVKVIQRWVSSGPSVKIQWYVVDIIKSCPVAIPSDVYAECVSPDMKQCWEKCDDKPQ